MSDNRTWGGSMAAKATPAMPSANGGTVVPFRGTAAPDTLPVLSGDYKAAATPANGEVVDLCVIFSSRHAAKRYWFFQYVHLASPGTVGHDDDGVVARFTFTGRKRDVDLIIRGRDVLAICQLISQHRIGWVRVADSEPGPAEAVDDSGQPVPFIRSITIADSETGVILMG